jgi:hypothetical protein
MIMCDLTLYTYDYASASKLTHPELQTTPRPDPPVYGMANWCSGCFTVSTGHGAMCTTFSAVPPISACARPVRPCVPMTIRSISIFSRSSYDFHKWLPDGTHRMDSHALVGSAEVRGQPLKAATLLDLLFLRAVCHIGDIVWYAYSVHPIHVRIVHRNGQQARFVNLQQKQLCTVSFRERQGVSSRICRVPGEIDRAKDYPDFEFHDASSL